MFAKRTESLDAVEIEKLITPTSIDIFGKPNLLNVIEKSLLSVTITSVDGDIIGYGSFYDYPNIPEIDCGDDFDKLVALHNFPLANSLNSFFMHYFLAKADLEASILMDMINTVFNTASNIHYIFLNSAKDKLTDSLSKQFSTIGCSKSSKLWYGLKREAYMPTLYIRVAKPDDMDDLTPIFDAQSTILKDIYGEFYIAEMIAAQNETTKCLVAEVGGYAVGFLSVTTEADVDLLNRGYFIEPFGGFRKVISDDSNQESINFQSAPFSEDARSHTTEHSVPVVLSDQQFESSLSGTVTEKTDMSHDHEYRSPSANSNPYLDPTTLPVFEGSPNALIIQMFAINEAYEMRSIDFLQNVFELFPKKDYLLITVPYLVPEFVLLDNFVRVTPRPGIILPHELYAFHKASLVSSFQVRPACKSDQEAIENLISNMNLSHHIITDLDMFHAARRTADGVSLFAHVAVCMDQIVGIAIMKQEEDIEYLRSHYNIEDFIYYNHHRRDEHGHIKHFALNPIFKRLSKIFLKEIMRKSHKTSLYYPIYKRWAPPSLLSEHSLPTNLPDLVPVRPRRQIVYDLERLEVNAPTDRVLQLKDGFCLTHFNRKLVMEPKVTINARIVVVGASTTGLSFLENLVFCPHLKFNNLILISPHGLPDNHDDDEFVEQLMGKDFYFSRKKLELSALRIQVHVVKGRMTAIDRRKKLIKVDGKELVPYDHMVIATGLQFAVPCPTEAKIKELPTTCESVNAPNRRYSETVFKKRTERVVPHNLFTVNDPFDAVKLLQFIRTSILNNDSRIIVYGHSYETYCCLHTILALGVPGWRIHFIKPPAEEENYPLNNPVVEEAVYQTLKEAGVAVHTNYCIAQFNDSDQIPLWISSASFTTHGPPLRLECRLFISYYQKVVDYTAFRAINDACLVFDARLVIDTFFHTNDLCIRGAGPITKFKRRYYNDQWNHSRFNSKVVGDELAKVVLRLFDPTLVQTVTSPVEEIPLIPMYNDPILRSCMLPGGYLYLSVSKPSLTIPYGVLTAQANYGTVLVTGTPQSEEGYFRLHINQYKKVETITCLRRKPFSVDNYTQLFGIHERALNNLLSRFNEKLIKDLYEFLDDNWAMAFYHDRFKDLKEEIKELLMTRSSPCKLSFEETVRQMMADGIELSREQRKKLMDEFVQTNAKSIVDQRLISFVSYNHYHLPMYARPDMV